MHGGTLARERTSEGSGPAQGPRRILLVRLSHLGDVVHTLPLFHAVRQAHPTAQIAWAIQTEFADLVRPLPGMARTLEFDRRGGLAAMLRLRREMHAFQPDWVIDGQGNIKSALVTRLAGAKRRSGFHKSDLRESAAAWALNDGAPFQDSTGAKHAIDRCLRLAAHVSGSSPQAVQERLPTDWLQLSEREREVGRELWRQQVGPSPKRPVVLQVAAPGDVRAWPLERQRELLRELHQQGRDVLVLSGPCEEDVGRALEAELQGLQRLHHWVGQSALRELVGTLRAAGEAGASMVCGDSGPLHLAAAAGMKCVLLAGPQDEYRTGPWPVPGPDSPHRVLHARAALECAPCLARRCTHLDGPVCMERIDAGQVLQSLE
ncbi:MAG: heptosyltransferase-1 [Candidatus Paceibacteria bacterium]|jgi:heptosyltransferase-1